MARQPPLPLYCHTTLLRRTLLRQYHPILSKRGILRRGGHDLPPAFGAKPTTAAIHCRFRCHRALRNGHHGTCMGTRTQHTPPYCVSTLFSCNVSPISVVHKPAAERQPERTQQQQAGMYVCTLGMYVCTVYVGPLQLQRSLQHSAGKEKQEKQGRERSSHSQPVSQPASLSLPFGVWCSCLVRPPPLHHNLHTAVFGSGGRRLAAVRLVT